MAPATGPACHEDFGLQAGFPAASSLALSKHQQGDFDEADTTYCTDPGCSSHGRLRGPACIGCGRRLGRRRWGRWRGRGRWRRQCRRRRGCRCGRQWRRRGQRVQCLGQCSHPGDTRHARDASHEYIACNASHACDAGHPVAAVFVFVVHDVSHARDAGSARFQGRQHDDDACGACNAGTEEVRNGASLSARPMAGSGQLPAGQCRGGSARLDAQLLEDVLEMLVDRARAGAEDLADVAVGLALGEP
ncbi:hypothetical protein FB547_106202 [Variovorax beijingensis]|uniref:Uncharacterized protein n=1 Tax=Variovorax beijingensis TaxID=2496117 RepID=A0A561C247_9BURK|nr:hypothetical protein FB547_106202 [Variovorax beijingensis]